MTVFPSKKYSFLVLYLLFLLALACQPQKSDPNTTGQKVPANHLSFRSQTRVERSDNCQPDTCATISLQYVRAEGRDTPLRDSLNQYVQHYLLRQQLMNNPDADLSYQGDAAEFITKQFFEQYDAFRKETYGQGAFLGWEFRVTMKPIYQTATLISLQLNSQGFLGGAHGFDVTSLQSFDHSGHALQVKEMVTDTLQLRQVIEQEFRRVRKLGQESFAELGFFTQGQGLPFPQQAALTEKGLLMYYNAYEVNAYAFGPTELLVPYSRLGHLLRSAYLPAK